MGEIIETAEALWTGQKDTYTVHPFSPPHGLEALGPGTWFYKGFSNAIVRETNEGLILVDPAALFDTQPKFDAIRAATSQPLNTAIFTHGHVDHVFGVGNYAQEAEANGWPKPRIVAQEALPARLRRYAATQAWNSHINNRQFRGGTGPAVFPGEFDFPDITFRDRMTLTVGGITAELRHARGETDDHLWVFFPDNRLLCTGDLFIWAVPNAGNPQKVQRYAREWAAALREMAALRPEILAPGHGFPIIGADRVSQALSDTAGLLESVHEQTLALMNKGASLNEILHAVKAPSDLSAKPYLQPVYDESEFIVRNVWRFYGGWYDGRPSHLKPAAEQTQAEEAARLAGGADRLASRARELAEAGRFRLACHLADWACLVAPDQEEIRRAAESVYLARAQTEPSTMAMGIYLSAARQFGPPAPADEPPVPVFIKQMERGKPTTAAD